MKRVQWLVPVVVATVLAWSGGSWAMGTASSAAAAAKRASGTVKSVAADSLTLTGADGKDMMFMVDAKTHVTAKGATTKSKEKGGKTSVTDLVAMGDKVTVSYHDMGGTMHAADVRVTAKATGK